MTAKTLQIPCQPWQSPDGDGPSDGRHFVCGYGPSWCTCTCHTKWNRANDSEQGVPYANSFADTAAGAGSN
jgi:hypothetical protein